MGSWLCSYFVAEGCELRIGAYESFDTLCIYLESDAAAAGGNNAVSGGAGAERNFWVKYRIAVLRQKRPELTEWKESAICTKTWNNSVLQFMKARSPLEQCSTTLYKQVYSHLEMWHQLLLDIGVCTTSYRPKACNPLSS